jgi:hypothetical protein
MNINLQEFEKKYKKSFGYFDKSKEPRIYINGSPRPKSPYFTKKDDGGLQANWSFYYGKGNWVKEEKDRVVCWDTAEELKEFFGKDITFDELVVMIKNV